MPSLKNKNILNGVSITSIGDDLFI